MTELSRFYSNKNGHSLLEIVVYLSVLLIGLGLTLNWGRSTLKNTKDTLKIHQIFHQISDSRYEALAKNKTVVTTYSEKTIGFTRRGTTSKSQTIRQAPFKLTLGNNHENVHLRRE